MRRGKEEREKEGSGGRGKGKEGREEREKVESPSKNPGYGHGVPTRKSPMGDRGLLGPHECPCQWHLSVARSKDARLSQIARETNMQTDHARPR